MNGFTWLFIVQREAPKGSLLKRERERERERESWTLIKKMFQVLVSLPKQAMTYLAWSTGPCQAVSREGSLIKKHW